MTLPQERKKSVFYEKTTKHFGRFAEETTLHGFPEIHNSRNTHLKIFWTVILVISTIAVAYEIYKVIGDYTDRPIITLYDWKSVNAFEFPQVEICSENMINFTKLKELKLHSQVAVLAKMTMPDSITIKPFEKSLGHSYGDVFNYPIFFKVVTQPTKGAARTQLKEILQELKPAASSGPAFEILFSIIQEELIPLFPNETTGNNTDYFALHFASVKKLLNDDGGLNLEKFFDIAGFELEKVLMSCAFMGDPVNCSEIAVPVYDQRYGRCFVIDVKRRQTIGGFGLLMVINTNSAFNIPDLPNFQEGIQVRIDKEINPISLNILRVPTRTATTIGLKPTYYNLDVSESFGRCFTDIDRLAITYPYSDTTCRFDCFVNYTMGLCNCSLAVPKQFIKTGFEHRACATFKEEQCLQSYMQRTAMASHMHDCVNRCRPSCKFWDYSPTVTYNNFPSKALVRRLLETNAYGTGIFDFDAKKTILGEDGKNSIDDLIMLAISFTELSYMDVSQQIAITFDGFISQIGGIFGLFLGASLISFVQIASFFALKCCCPLLKSAGRRPSNSNNAAAGSINQGENSRVAFSNV